jgi:hypothetical protein
MNLSDIRCSVSNNTFFYECCELLNQEKSNDEAWKGTMKKWNPGELNKWVRKE